MRIIESQIPLSSHNWLNFHFINVLEVINNAFTKNDLNEIISIKVVPTKMDSLFAPLCLLFNKKPKRKANPDGTFELKWYPVAIKLLRDDFFQKIQNIDKDTLEEEIVLEAFAYLNNEELEIAKVRAINSSLASLVTLCQSIISYHILVHPYRIRNPASTLIE